MSVISLVSALLNDINSGPDGRNPSAGASGQRLLSAGGDADAQHPRAGFPVILDQHLHKGSMPAGQQLNQAHLSGLLYADTVESTQGGMSLPPERPVLPLAYNTLPFAEPMSLDGQTKVHSQTLPGDPAFLSDPDLSPEPDMLMLSGFGDENIRESDYAAGSANGSIGADTLPLDVPDEVALGTESVPDALGVAQSVEAEEWPVGARDWLEDGAGSQPGLMVNGSRTAVGNEVPAPSEPDVWSGPVLPAIAREPLITLAESANAAVRQGDVPVPIALPSAVRGLMQRFSEQFGTLGAERGGESLTASSSDLRSATGNVQLSGFAQHLIQQQSAQHQRASADAELQQTLNPSRQQGAGTDAGAGDRFFQSAGGAARWSESLSQSIALLASRGSHTAHIQLDPPELGKLMIRIQVTGDQASINFASPHVAVRDALETGAGRLQDMLSEQGLSLKDMDVSDQHSGDRRQGTVAADTAGQEEDGVEDDGTLRVLGDSMGLIDDYA